MPVKYDNIQDRKDGRWIRLLYLQPSDSQNKVIEVNLKTVSLETSPTYEALSYCWGNPKTTTRIKCNGDKVDVTKNLFQALKHLRYPDHARVLWVDALCINQEDPFERCHQVNIMSSIYKLAKTVVIWLGPAVEGSDAAFSYLNKGFAQLQRCSSSTLDNYAKNDNFRLVVDFPSIIRRLKEEAAVVEQADTDSSQTHSQASGWYDAVEIGDCTEEELTGFWALARLPWWSRVWVIQELCLASAVSIVCGDSVAPWDALSFGIARGFQYEDNRLEILRPPQAYLLAARLRLATSNLPLLEALSLFQSCQASDKRDKVYALLGIATNLHVSPDYTISVEQCYINTARAILSHTRDLAVLDCAGLPSNSAQRQLPSWVPDWSRDANVVQGSFTNLADPQFSLALTHEEQTESDTALLESKLSFEGDHILILKGIELDRITMVGEIIRMVDPDALPNLYFPGGWRKPVSNSLRIIRFGWAAFFFFYRFGISIHSLERLLAFARRANAKSEGLDPDDPQSPATILMRAAIRHSGEKGLNDVALARVMLEFFDSFTIMSVYCWFRFLSIHWILPPLYDLLLAAILIIQIIQDKLDEDDDSLPLLAKAADHRPALTLEGRLYIAPRACRVGDRLTWLRGGKHPYIVRSSAGTEWELVGPCHVTGGHLDELRGRWQDEKAQVMRFV